MNAAGSVGENNIDVAGAVIMQAVSAGNRVGSEGPALGKIVGAASDMTVAIRGENTCLGISNETAARRGGRTA